jgi:serine/threonine-protein kinase RsbW
MNAPDDSPDDLQEMLGCLTLRRLSEREAVIREILDRVASLGLSFDPHLHYLCLDEALINAIVHGNQSDPNKCVRVRVFGSADAWRVEVDDEGEGFDWEHWKRRLDDGMDLARSGGRGLELILASGADVDFLNGGKCLRMTWRSEDESELAD